MQSPVPRHHKSPAQRSEAQWVSPSLLPRGCPFTERADLYIPPGPAVGLTFGDPNQFSKMMNHFLQSVESIEAFLRDYSDLPLSQAQNTAGPEPQPCRPLTAHVEGSQPESTQSQAMSPGKTERVTSESWNVPGVVLTQNANRGPGKALGKLMETVPVTQQGEPSDASEASADYWATISDSLKALLADCQKTTVTDSMMTRSHEGSHMKTRSDEETADELHSHGLGGRQLKTSSERHPDCGGQPGACEGLHGMTASGHQNAFEKHKIPPSCGQTFSGGQMTTPTDNHALYQVQMTMPSYGPTVYGGQMTTHSSGQAFYNGQVTTPSDGHTLYRKQMISPSSNQYSYGGQVTTPIIGPLFYGSEMMTTSGDQMMSTSSFQNLYGGHITSLSGEQTLYGGQMTSLRGDQTLYVGQMTSLSSGQTLHGGPMTSLSSVQALYGDRMTPSSAGQTLHGEQMMSASDGQSLYGGQMTANTGQTLNSDPMMSFVNNQTHCGGHTMNPEFQYVSPLAQGQLSSFSMDNYGHLPRKQMLKTKSQKFLHKSSTLKPYVCTYENCGKSYGKSSHLQVHKRKHTGEKPYVCNEKGCSWKFAHSDELNRHKKRHSGNDPYFCMKCNKNFARLDHLKQHEKCHLKFSNHQHSPSGHEDM